MKLTKKVIVPAVPAQPEKIVDEYDKTVCDICGAKIIEEPYRVHEVTLQYETGYRYPEGGSGELTKYDICPECFTDKMVPWLAAQGATPTEEEWDF